MVVAKRVVRDGQLFSTVNAAYNDACERRLPDRALFGKATHRINAMHGGGEVGRIGKGESFFAAR